MFCSVNVFSRIPPLVLNKLSLVLRPSEKVVRAQVKFWRGKDKMKSFRSRIFVGNVTIVFADAGVERHARDHDNSGKHV